MSGQSWDYIAKLVCIGDSGCGKSSLTIRLCEGRFSPQHDVTIGVEFGSAVVPVGGGKKASNGATTAASSPAKSSQQQRTSSSSSSTQKHMKLSLWDTAGQETYKSVTRSYFRGASGALLVFDLTRRESFVHVTDWLNDLRQIAEPDIVVVLVGNKSDLVEAEEAEERDLDASTTDPATGDRRHEADATDAKDSRPAARRKRQVTAQEAEQWGRDNQVLRYVETSAKSGHNVELAFLELANRIYDNIEAGRYDLNDRRSGVKGAGAAGGGRGAAAAAAAGAMSPARTVSLRMNQDDGRGRGGACC